MKTIDPYSLLMGTNDASHFLHAAQQRRDDISLSHFIKETGAKRRWSLVNPGIMLAFSYSYFVFGQENGYLDTFSLSPFLETIAVCYPSFDSMSPTDQSTHLKRRLRNSIAHCRYEVQIRTDDGAIHRDGDVWFVFQDSRPNGDDAIQFEMSLPTFGNIVESAGKHCANSIKAQQA
jgi:hypothetical protein